mmetsp:Transcript_27556/g.40665  ORF Transcript_27556/g.40665 Transcript_27556/m.40665 type:complete len:243 (-) Transcript_27556:10-738(-)
MDKRRKILVKYNNPIIIEERSCIGESSVTSNAVGFQKVALNSSSAHDTSDSDILNSMLPPRKRIENGKLWMQYISSTPATCLDVINLREELDRQLQSSNAKERGLCPIREDLYAQAFDEIIRQVTIHCTERGLLLLRIREESRLTLAAYLALYESGIAYGARKALLSNEKKLSLDKNAEDLIKGKDVLQERVKDMTVTIASFKQNSNQRSLQDTKRHDDEISRLQEKNKVLKDKLTKLLAEG